MAKPGNTTPPRIVTKKHIARQQREATQTRIITGVALGGIAIVLLLILYGYLRLNVFALREAVAEVNGEKITTGEWQERVRLERIRELNLLQQYAFYQQNFGMDTSQQQQQIMITLGTPSILGQQVLDAMIDEVIIRQEAQKLGITVTEEELEKSLQEVYGFFPEGTYTPTTTSTAFITPTLSSEQLTLYPLTATPTTAPTSTAAPTDTPDPSVTPTITATTAPPTPTFVPELPTATATPYTLDGYKSEYQKTLDSLKDYDISEAALRSVYEAQLWRQKLFEKLTADTPRTEEQAWARHILVDTEVEAVAAKELLNQGLDFAVIAQKYSKDTGSGAGGGDLGWFGKGMMVPEFETAVFSQEIGLVGDPVQTQFGYHIIQVLAREERPLNDSQYQQARETAFSDWLAKTRETATFTTFEIWQDRVPVEPQQLNTPTPE